MYDTLKVTPPSLKKYFCRKVTLDAQLMNFFIRRKTVSFWRNLDLICFCEIHKFQNLWHHHRSFLHNGSYTYTCFFWILSTIKNSFFDETCFWLMAGDWKLVPGPFMILLKWHYSEIWSFLIVEIYHDLPFLIAPCSPFQKKKQKKDS